MALDLNALTAVLKTKYEKDAPLLGYPESPGWALCKKMTDFTELNLKVPVENALPSGVGEDFGTALAAMQGTQYLAFLVTRRPTYAFAEVTTEAIRAGKGAIVQVFSREVDNAIRASAQNLAIQMYRNGGGALGQITSGSTTATVTLTNIGDAFNFVNNMRVQVAADDGTGGAGVMAGQAIITGIDPDLGTLTISGNWNAAFPAITNTSFIFRAGGYNRAIPGLLAWLPTTAPGAGDNFYGLPRGQNPANLAGARVTGSGGPIEETLISAAERLTLANGRPDTLLMNPFDRANLIKAKSSQVVLDRVSKIDTVPVDFTTFRMDGPRGPIEVFADTYCPRGTAFMLSRSTWSFRSSGVAPGIIAEAGSPAVYPNPTADSVITRVASYGAFVCSAPGWNAVITL